MGKKLNVSIFVVAILSSWPLWGTLLVSSVNPYTGPINVAQSVTIIGDGFTEVKDVYFGSVKSPQFQILSDNTLIATSPIPIGPSSGIVHVTVDNKQERSPISFTNRYTYTQGSWIGYLGGLCDLCDSQCNSIIPFSLASNPVPPPISLPGSSYKLAISPNNARLYIVNTDPNCDHKIVVVDIANNKIINQISYPSTPHDFATDTTGRKGYAIYGNQLSEINLLTNTIQSEITLSCEAFQLVLTPDGNKAYTSHYYDNCLSVIDLTTNTITESIPIQSPYSMAVSPDGTTVYVCTNVGVGYSINTANSNIESEFHIGRQPLSIAINPNGNEAYVTNFEDNNVNVINLQNNQTVPTTIPVGFGPTSIAITPDGTMAYVTNTLDGTVTPIDLLNYTPFDPEITNTYAEGLAITPDQSPIANFVATFAGFLTFNFDASSSITPVGEIAEYTWVFESDSEPNYTVTTYSPFVSHTFSTPAPTPSH